MICLCLSGASIYLLPYSTEVYYKPLQRALGVDNQDIGFLMSTLGVVNMLGYFPGGWLADRISPRRLLSFSLIATGAIGFYFATFPPYFMCIAVYAGWSLTSIFTFWSALIKATRDWGGDSEQGRAFGLLEGGRGIFRFVLSSLGVAVLGWVANETAAFSTVVSLYSGLNVALGIAVWFALGPSERAEKARPAPRRPSAMPNPRAESGQILRVLKLPATWLIAAVIFAAYSMYLGSFYFTPYATEGFGLGVVMAGYLASGKMILRPFAAAGGGVLGDRLRASRVIFVAFIVSFVSFTVFALTPVQSALLRVDDVPAPAPLTDALASPKTPLHEHLAQGLEVEISAGAALETAALARVLGHLNGKIDGELLFTEARFAGVTLRPETRAALEAAPTKPAEITRLNRMLVQDAFPGAIERLDPELAAGGAPWGMLALLVFNVALATLCLYVLRGLYYAMLQEAGIPAHLTGIACGVVSVLGYTPDIFLPPLVGYLLDRYPGGDAYRYVFGLVAAFCVIGVAASAAFVRLRTGEPDLAAELAQPSGPRPADA